MSLLREIQADLASAQADTVTVLLKCKILAARLKSEEFANWVDFEVNGYPVKRQLPEYRRLTVTYYGSFANFAYQFPRSPLPLRIVPEKYRDSFTYVEFRDGIAKAENLAKSKGNITIPKPDLVPAVEAATANMHCQEVWAEIPVNEFHQLLSVVKSRILDFVLKLESENPDAGEAPAAIKPIPEEKLRPLVQNVFYSSNIGAIAQNSQDFVQTVHAPVSAQDIEKLVMEFTCHLSELQLDPRQRERAKAQLSILTTESAADMDLGIVKQAIRTLRNITEGAISSLVATAVQPTVWHWIQQTVATLSK